MAAKLSNGQIPRARDRHEGAGPLGCPRGLGWLDLYAYAEMSGATIEPWEARALMQIEQVRRLIEARQK